jgi:D-alanine-D-alanine ligase
MKGSLAFIYGGRGLEREVSLLGADFLFPIIEKAGWGVIPVYIEEDGRWTVLRRGDEFIRPDKHEGGECAGLINLGGRGGICLGGECVVIDLAIPLLHGDFGEDGSVQGALENAHIPYVGEGVLVSALCLDKAICRERADRFSLPGAKWIAPPLGLSPEGAMEMAEAALGYPMFIKPRSLGSSIGARSISCREDFYSAYTEASDGLKRRVIIEEYVDIDSELEISVIRHKGKYIFTKVGKIKNEFGFYSYGDKYSPSSPTTVDPKPCIPRDIEEKILGYARAIVSSLEIRSLARVDFFLDKSGKIYFNEINTMPGFTASSLFPNLFFEMGIDACELLQMLIEEALS